MVYEVPTDADGLTLQFDFSGISLFNLERAIVNLDSEASSVANLEQNLKVETYAVGDTVEYKGTKVAVNDVSTTESLGEFTEADSGKEFVVIDISTTNETGEKQTISTIVQMLLKDGEGFSYQEDLMATSSLDRNYEQGSPLADGETRRGRLAYEVEAGLSPLYWIFDFSLWTEQDKTFWKIR